MTSPAIAQRLRFADPFQNQQGNAGLVVPQTVPPNLLQGNPNPGNAAFPAVQNLPQLPSLQVPNFADQPPALAPNVQFGDPFQSQIQPFPVFPGGAAPPQPQFQVLPPQNLPGFNPAVSAPGFNQPQFNPGASPTFNGLPAIDWTRQQFQAFRNDFLPRVLERPRFSQTYLAGSDDEDTGNELDINDIEFATTLTRPNFLGSQQPLRISPAFIAHFWDGPVTSSTGFDLPSQAFTGLVAFDHVTNLANPTGFETNFTVGIYSDFDNFSSDALRFTGRLVRWRRINSYIVGKFGVEYFDRVDVKLLPAFGLFLSPNPDIKFDLFFPRSKLAHRIPNLGRYEMWANVSAEYGGGSWAIDRTSGDADQVDINDVRATIGIEWIGPRGITGFLDVGYVFSRELVFQSDQLNQLDLEDTVIVRSGIAF